MRRLTGEIPRGFRDSRSREARRYRAAIRAVLDAYGTLPDVARPVLVEYGRAVVELDRLQAELESAHARRRRAEINRARRHTFALREQLGRLEARLRAFAAERPTGDPLAAVRAAVEAANRRAPE